MAVGTTGDQIALVETNSPFERVNFQFMPEGIEWKRNARINSIAVVGRNNDLLQYTGGSDILNFSIDFYSDVPDRTDVMKKVAFLKSLAMSDGYFGPARNVKLVMGSFFRNEVWVVRNVNAKYSQLDNRFQYLPIRASVDIQLVLDPKRNRRIRDVRR